MQRRLVLFVCEHGAAKSVVATAHFNQLARRSGLSAFAASRGITPESVVDPVVRTGMEAEGLNTDVTPVAVTPEMARTAARIVTFGVDLPFAVPAATRVESWADVPPLSRDYDASRAAISARVAALIEEMLAAQKQDEENE
jgi:arsenate reductase (thioredoxin)